ncbi:TonB family protein [Alteromonas sp. 1_MG-2023]|uniref:energy transducer TonB n=1 Tax=Alteromonas sp. 1_MG-2023 TaxID=3062669 RepID=UPI0026E41096|nr:energy transducer TonB [Alteromonas sp. 1_MG-2023]MDO6566070.1 TonB family protein [Alteromonas sp. 1_MG-2023]
MNTFSQANPFISTSFKPIGYIVLSILITFALFAIMAKLIENNQVGVKVTEYQTVGPVVLSIDDPKVIVRTPIKPMEKPVAQPPMEIPKADPTPNDSNPTFSFKPQFTTTKVNINPNFQSGKGDMQASPQFRVDPAFPPEAMRDGIEGWVKLGFTVASNGTVQDIHIIEAEPKRVFDRAARRALSKWKYKPKMENGVPVAQHDMFVLLEFRFDES